MKNCDFFEAVATWSDEMNSYYKDCIIDRTRLFEFMEMNDWFDLHVKYLSQREKLLLREKPFLMRSQDIQQLRGRIEIWLSAYKKTNKKKLKILMIYRFICIISHFICIYYRLIESVGCF